MSQCATPPARLFQHYAKQNSTSIYKYFPLLMPSYKFYYSVIWKRWRRIHFCISVHRNWTYWLYGYKNEDKDFLDEYAIRLEVKSNQERNISYQMVYNKLVPGQHMSINDAWSAFKTSLKNYACLLNRPLLNRIDCPA